MVDLVPATSRRGARDQGIRPGVGNSVRGGSVRWPNRRQGNRRGSRAVASGLGNSGAGHRQWDQRTAAEIPERRRARRTWRGGGGELHRAARARAATAARRDWRGGAEFRG